MAWFKKDEGEDAMVNANSSGRPGADASTSRPEPREARVEPRETRPEPRSPGAAAAAPAPSSSARMENKAPEGRLVESSSRASVLGPTLRFRGELSAQEDLVVQGSVEGSITHTQNLTIGADGSMKGDIRARVIVVDGKVDGDLYATESVSVRTNAKVKGNVFAPRVAVAEGAFFLGKIDMQPSGAAVQEHSARMRQAALAAPAQDMASTSPVASAAPTPAVTPVLATPVASGGSGA